MKDVVFMYDDGEVIEDEMCFEDADVIKVCSAEGYSNLMDYLFREKFDSQFFTECACIRGKGFYVFSNEVNFYLSRETINSIAKRFEEVKRKVEPIESH